MLLHTYTLINKSLNLKKSYFCSPNKQSQRRKKRSTAWNQYKSEPGTEKITCKARYQQSPIEVFARFLAIDQVSLTMKFLWPYDVNFYIFQNSGRISYFISRRTGLRVTDLVQPLLRVSDPKVATLKGRILQGKSMGRTDIQVKYFQIFYLYRLLIASLI